MHIQRDIWQVIKIAPFNSIASIGLAQVHPSGLSLLCLSNCRCTISRAVTEKSDTSTVPKGRAGSPFGIACPRTNNPLSRGVPGIKTWGNVEDRKMIDKNSQNGIGTQQKYMTQSSSSNKMWSENSYKPRNWPVIALQKNMHHFQDQIDLSKIQCKKDDFL